MNDDGCILPLSGPRGSDVQFSSQSSWVPLVFEDLVLDVLEAWGWSSRACFAKVFALVGYAHTTFSSLSLSLSLFFLFFFVLAAPW